MLQNQALTIHNTATLYIQEHNDCTGLVLNFTYRLTGTLVLCSIRPNRSATQHSNTKYRWSSSLTIWLHYFCTRKPFRLCSACWQRLMGNC